MNKTTTKVFIATLSIISVLSANSPSHSQSLEAIDGNQAKDSVKLELQNDKASSADSACDRFIKNRLSIGLRSSVQILTDADSGHRGGTNGSGTFLGTIYALDESQNLAPIHPFITYDISPWISVELAYDYQKAQTLAASGSVDKSDGDVILQGPTLSLVGRYRNSTSFTPFFGLGVGFYSADFDESDHWALGYPNEVTYVALGSPSSLYNGRSRWMETEDTIVLLLQAGLTYAMTPSWFLDLTAQYFRSDVDATFHGYTNGVPDTEITGEFPMDNLSIRIGVGYHF
jgi:outer membrane protein W